MRRTPFSRQARPCILGLWLLVALLAAAASWQAGTAAAAPLVTGVSNVYSNESAAFTNVVRTGSTTALGPLRWNVIAPAQQPANWNPEDPADPHYEWKYFDEWVTHAVAAGLIPILDVRGAPRWAERCVRVSEEAVCDPDPAALAAFTRAAVRRYSGTFGGLPRVRYWQGLNEPNLSIFFEPQYQGDTLVSPDLYRNLIDTFYSAVKSVEPTDLVVAAGLGPIAVPHYTVAPMAFARKLLCMTGTNKDPRPGDPGPCAGGVGFDIFDVHPYTTGGPTHQGGPNDVEIGDLWKLKKLLTAADKAGRIKSAFKRTPLWVTEFGWDSNPPDPGGLSMKIEKQWIPEALQQAWRNGVANFMWYSLDDFPPEPSVPFSQTLQTGLYFWAPTAAQEQPKPLMRAYRFPIVVVRYRNGLKVWGRTPTSKGGSVVIQVRSGGKWRKLTTLKAERDGIFRGKVKTDYGSKRKGSARAVFAKEASVSFPMKRVGDFPHPPFG